MGFDIAQEERSGVPAAKGGGVTLWGGRGGSRACREASESNGGETTEDEAEESGDRAREEGDDVLSERSGKRARGLWMPTQEEVERLSCAYLARFQTI
jgi:hypothetical protein